MFAIMRMLLNTSPAPLLDDLRKLARSCEFNDEIYQRLPAVVEEYTGTPLTDEQREQVERHSAQERTDWRPLRGERMGSV